MSLLAVISQGSVEPPTGPVANPTITNVNVVGFMGSYTVTIWVTNNDSQTVTMHYGFTSFTHSGNVGSNASTSFSLNTSNTSGNVQVQARVAGRDNSAIIYSSWSV